MPLSGSTALEAIVDSGAVTAGQQVLITGASGGLGSCAVQMAKSVGAEVTGTARPAKPALVQALGADHVLEYNRDDLADGFKHYDLIRLRRR